MRGSLREGQEEVGKGGGRITRGSKMEMSVLSLGDSEDTGVAVVSSTVSQRESQSEMH